MLIMPLISSDYSLALVQSQTENHYNPHKRMPDLHKSETMGVTPANVVEDESVNFRNVHNNTHKNWWQDRCQLLFSQLMVTVSNKL